MTPSPRAILTSGQVQVEFLDTPGIVTQEAVDKFKLKPEVVKGEMITCKLHSHLPRSRGFLHQG